MNLLQELQERTQVACTPLEGEIESMYNAISAYCLYQADKGHVCVSFDILELEQIYDIDCRSSSRLDAFARAISRVRVNGVEVTYEDGFYTLNWRKNESYNLESRSSS
jgi:hypothetical protein